jgi:alpha-tubulin suppressor-like RCC1 family protein
LAWKRFTEEKRWIFALALTTDVFCLLLTCSWMDGQDTLYIEVWEKRVIGPEVCIGRITLNKAAMPLGTANVWGFWTPPVTLPLQSPKEKKVKGLGELKSGASSTTIVRDGSNASLSIPERANTVDLLESSSERNPSRGTITFRLNYESRHQEWLDLAPLRGKFFTWGATHSQAANELVLTPQVVKGLEEVVGHQKVQALSMSCGYFSARLENGDYATWGMDFKKIQDGEHACFSHPSIFRVDLPEKIVNSSCGISHFLLVSEQGHIYSLGLNERGELGQGTASEKADFTPRRVIGLQHEIIVGADAGRCHSLAWTKDGKLFSWGDASLVRMWTPETDWIDGPFDHLGHTDEEEAERENRDIAPVPKRVQGLDGVKIVKAYTNLSISAAISDVGDLYTWGDHHCAGYDTKNLNVQYPQKIEALAGRVVAAAVGPSFVVALDVDGQLWSWGCMFQKNSSPRVAFPLGRGGARSFQPEPIQGLPPIKDISCTGTTMYALDIDGQLWCWGDSPYGECFRPGVTIGTPVKCEFFQDVKVALIAQGYGNAFGVYTSPD